MLSQENNEQIYLTILFDEMAIRQLLERSEKEVYGLVNFGGDMGDISDSDATDVLANNMFVVMAVCLNKPWKIPIAYFPVKGVRGNQKHQIIKMAIEYCFECGAEVMNVTGDAIASNITCAKLLGCNINDVEHLKSTFTNEKYNKEICFFLDPVHALKLMRNLFENYKILYDSDRNRIDYQLLEKLVDLQESENLHLGNKLTRAHVNFRKKIMNVKLAAQLLSDSVADALEFCGNELELEEFKDISGTVKFIRMCNKIFDILNSRSIAEKQPFKRALSHSNIDRIKIFCDEAISYLKGNEVTFR